MAGILRRVYDGFRTVVPRQSLPGDGWGRIPGVARMDLVWPWFVSDEPGRLVDSHGRDLDHQPLTELRAPRTDGDVVMTVWTEPGASNAVAADWGRSLAGFYGGVLRSSVPILLGTAAGQLAQIAHGSLVSWRIVVPGPQFATQVEVTAPAQHAEAYWLQVESMLATWSWAG